MSDHAAPDDGKAVEIDWIKQSLKRIETGLTCVETKIDAQFKDYDRRLRFVEAVSTITAWVGGVLGAASLLYLFSRMVK